MSEPSFDFRPLVNARILVVEDERIIAKDIAQTLRSLSYEVCAIVDTGEDAVRRALEEKPDLVLMDIHLAGRIDGIEAADRIHASLDVPVVFLTAFADEATLQRAKAAGPFGYVLKPFDDRDLQIATIMALCKHRAFLDLDRKVQERTEELVRSEARFRQMAAVADLGAFALRTHELQPVLDRTVRVVSNTIGTELTKLLELRPDGQAFLLRAGVGWKDGLVGTALIGAADHESQAAFTLRSRGTIVAEDLRTERRFRPPPLLLEHGVLSGMSVIVLSAGDERPYGVLGTHCRSRRDFNSNETNFVQAVANLLGATVARVRADERRLAAERQMEEARAKAASAQEAINLRDEFLSIASHELKTPLTALRLQLQSLSARLDEVDGRVATKIERATRSTDRLAALVENLLDVSRLTTGRIELRAEEVTLQELVDEVMDRIAEAAARAGCQLRVVDHAEGALIGRWDRLRIEQTLMNLIANALKYGAGSPIEVRLERSGEAAELIVEDGGPGVAPDQAERIFNRFERASSIRNYGGLGLGLYISRQLVEAHGGTVGVQSVPGKGASFIVRLPLAKREPQAPRSEQLQ